MSADRNATRSNAEVVRGVQSQLAAQSRKDELDALATRLNTLQLVEAIQMYKLQAAYERLRREPARPVLLLDATSLVGSRACFDELLACNEDIVISAEPKRGCPPALSFVLGAVANTGVTLIRSGGLPFLRSVLVHQRGRYQHHCYEQEAFNAQLVASRFTWASFPYVGTTADEHGGRAPNGTTFRFLNYSHWPRTYKKKRRRSTANGAAAWTRLEACRGTGLARALCSTTRIARARALANPHPNAQVGFAPSRYASCTAHAETWFSEPPELACLFHPWVTDKSQHIAIYKQAGRWYL